MIQPAVAHQTVGDPQSGPAHPPDQPVLFCDEPDSDLELVDGGVRGPNPDFRVGRVLRICQQTDGSHFIRYLSTDFLHPVLGLNSNSQFIQSLLGMARSNGLVKIKIYRQLEY